MPVEESRRPKKKLLRKRWLFALFFIELIFCIILISIASTMVSLNQHDEIIYTDNTPLDDISCTDGQLRVNNVAVSVPDTDNVTYNISYAWAEKDTDYPSIPKTITATYKDEQGIALYDISLYRESFIPSSQIPAGKSAETWFDDWEKADEAYLKKQPLEASKFKGFSITNLDADEAAELKSTTYLTDTFYFAIEEDDGISVYVLEGILYNSEHKETLINEISKSIQSIVLIEESTEEDNSDEGVEDRDENEEDSEQNA